MPTIDLQTLVKNVENLRASDPTFGEVEKQFKLVIDSDNSYLVELTKDAIIVYLANSKINQDSAWDIFRDRFQVVIGKFYK